MKKKQQLVAALVNGHSQSDDASHEGIEKTIVINPNSQVYRQGTFLESDIATVIDKPIYGTSQLERGESLNKHVVCDVPSVGYAVLGSANSGEAIPGDRGQRSGGVSKSNSSLLVDELTIRNEFIEVIIDQATGGIRALHDYKTRGNRLSQVLAYRGKSKHEQQRFAYSEMKLDSIRTTANSTTFGEIVTEGKLIWDGQSVAGFRQAFSLFKGSRVVEVAVEFFEAESEIFEAKSKMFEAKSEIFEANSEMFEAKFDIRSKIREIRSSVHGAGSPSFAKANIIKNQINMKI